jgi:hypothetical protein
MSRNDINALAAKLIAHQNRTQVAASTSGLLKNLKNDLATRALCFATTKLGKDLGYQHPNIPDIALIAVTDFVKTVENATSHDNPTGLLGKIVDRRKFDHFNATTRQPQLADVDDDDALERLSVCQPIMPLSLTVTSEVLDAIYDGRIKGRAADGVRMIIDGESNLDVSDRQAVKRGKEKLRDVFGEEYRQWGS